MLDRVEVVEKKVQKRSPTTMEKITQIGEFFEQGCDDENSQKAYEESYKKGFQELINLALSPQTTVNEKKKIRSILFVSEGKMVEILDILKPDQIENFLFHMDDAERESLQEAFNKCNRACHSKGPSQQKRKEKLAILDRIIRPQIPQIEPIQALPIAVATSSNTFAQIHSTVSVTDFYNVVKSGNTELVVCLLASGADVNRPDGRGWTPLMCAAEKGHLDIVNLLLTRGANVDLTKIQGKTPLRLAAQKGHLEIVKLLLTSGADVNRTDKYECTALMFAVEKGHLDIVKLLLISDTNVNRPDAHGWTPLRLAAEKGYLDIVKLLLTSSADVNHTDQYERTALKVAELRCDEEMVKILKENGAQ